MAKKDEYRRYNDVLRRMSGSAVRPYHEDGYVNMMTRYGTSKDVTEQYKFVPEAQVPDELLTMHYESNGLFAKIIDAPAEEAIKHGFELEGISDQQTNEFWKNGLDILDWEENAITAMKWARLFGGAIIVMLIDDGRGIDEPVDFRHVKSISDLVVYDRSVITPDYSSVFKYVAGAPEAGRGNRLGMPEYFYVFSRYGNFTVHESRCLIFRNGVLPENTTNSIYQLWGVPEYIRINKALRDAEVAHGSATKLLDRSVQPIYKMQDLSAELATEEGEGRVLKRLEAIDMARGMLNSIVIDSSGEDYDFKSFQFTGVSQVIDSTCNLLSAITSIPQTILFGRSPSGMNATGHGDMENYYNYVERNAQRMVKPNLRKLLNILFRAGVHSGEVEEIPQINVKFNPLWNLTESEQLDIDTKRAQLQQVKAGTANAYVGMQALDPSEVRKKLAETGEFDVESILDDMSEEEIENMPGQQGGDMGGMMPGMGGPGGMPGAPGGAPDGMPMGAPPDGAGGGAPAEGPQMGQESPQGAPGAMGGAGMPTTPKGPQNAAEGQEKAEPEKKDSAGLGSVGVLVIRDGKVLCGRRLDAGERHYIGGPGGHIEEGEDPAYAAMRETDEEFGIVPNELLYIGRGPTEDDTGLTPYVFLCTDFEGEPKGDGEEMADASFVPLDDLVEMRDYLFEPFADSLTLFIASLMNKDGRVDADDDSWKTIKGVHVLTDSDGVIVGGPQTLRDFSAAKKKPTSTSANVSVPQATAPQPSTVQLATAPQIPKTPKSVQPPKGPQPPQPPQPPKPVRESAGASGAQDPQISQAAKSTQRALDDPNLRENLVEEDSTEGLGKPGIYTIYKDISGDGVYTLQKSTKGKYELAVKKPLYLPGNNYTDPTKDAYKKVFGKDAPKNARKEDLRDAIKNAGYDAIISHGKNLDFAASVVPLAPLTDDIFENMTEKAKQNLPSERKVVSGKNIIDSYKGSKSITGIVEAQGFGGLPKLASKEEFDKAVEASGVLCVRGYYGSSQKVLDAYRDALYNGTFYVECAGGSMYGKGMYSHSGPPKNAQSLNDAAKVYSEDDGYIETMTLDPSANVWRFSRLHSIMYGKVDPEEKTAIQKETILSKAKELKEKYGEDAEKSYRMAMRDKYPISGIMSLEEKQEYLKKSKKLNGAYNGAKEAKAAISDSDNQINKAISDADAEVKKLYNQVPSWVRNSDDCGKLAALMGVDAYTVDPVYTGNKNDYTVILNRTKTIILDQSVKKDAEDDSPITFKLGKDGTILAMQNGKVIGWVKTQESGEDDVHEDSVREDDEWKTIKGTHVLVDDDEVIKGGPDTLKAFSANRKAAKSQKPAEPPKPKTGGGVQTVAEAGAKLGDPDVQSYDDRFTKVYDPFYKEIGYDGKALTVSEKEFDSIESKYPVRYLVLEGEDTVESFLLGDEYKAKDTIDGAGIRIFDEQNNAKKSASKGDEIIEVKLDPSANVITEDEMFKKFGEFNKSEKPEGVSENAWNFLKGNPGTVAAALGYDAIVDSYGEMTVLNRAKLITKKPGPAGKFEGNDDVVDVYKGKGTIKAVLKARGYDGLPKVMGKKEFDEAVKQSSFIAQRGYKASSQEVLDAYHDQLLHGEFYVECSGGASYGMGMYCAADSDGVLSENTEHTSKQYSHPLFGKGVGRVETFTLDPSANIGNYFDLSSEYNGVITGDDLDKLQKESHKKVQEKMLPEIEKKYGKDAADYSRYWSEGDIPKTKELNIEPGLVKELQKIGDSIHATAQSEAKKGQFELKQKKNERSKILQEKFADIGAFAAAKGYDAYYGDDKRNPGCYTVILNRSKCIFLDEGNQDAADPGKITFKLGKNGRILAYKGGKVIGWVKQMEGPSEGRKDGVTTGTSIPTATVPQPSKVEPAEVPAIPKTPKSTKFPERPEPPKPPEPPKAVNDKPRDKNKERRGTEKRGGANFDGKGESAVGMFDSFKKYSTYEQWAAGTAKTDPNTRNMARAYYAGVNAHKANKLVTRSDGKSVNMDEWDRVKRMMRKARNDAQSARARFDSIDQEQKRERRRKPKDDWDEFDVALIEKGQIPMEYTDRYFELEDKKAKVARKAMQADEQVKKCLDMQRRLKK